jgi:hypothetical protein
MDAEDTRWTHDVDDTKDESTWSMYPLVFEFPSQLMAPTLTPERKVRSIGVTYNRLGLANRLEHVVHLGRRPDLVGRRERDEHERDDDGEESTGVDVVGEEGRSESSDPDVDDYSDGNCRGNEMSRDSSSCGWEWTY